MVTMVMMMVMVLLMMMVMMMVMRMAMRMIGLSLLGLRSGAQTLPARDSYALGI